MTVPPTLRDLSADLCLKCTICTASCPVAVVTDLFPGPKYVGPQAERFRDPGQPVPDAGSLDYCTGCGICSRACPHEVHVAEIIALARSRYFEKKGLSLRNRLFSQPELVGKIGAAFAPLSNIPLKLKPVRGLVEVTLGIDHRAAFADFARPSFRQWFKRHEKEREDRPAGHKVLYFHGCSVNHYEPWIGKTAVAILEHNDCDVIIGEQNCCGLPAQMNGNIETMQRMALASIEKLTPYIREGYVVVGTSTSCMLNLKYEYRSIVGIAGEDIEMLGRSSYDICEFLWMLHEAGQLRTDFRRIERRVPYHPPCQLTNHGIGHPATRLLNLVPGLEIVETDAPCCGGGGTYNFKTGKYDISQAVGQQVFEAIAAVPGTQALCDSETCRWWIGGQTGREMLHPIQLLAEAYELKFKP